MDKYIIEFCSGLGWGGELLLIALELICATLFSGVIGYERESHGHAAGLRTHILVSIGACLIMIVSVNAPAFRSFATRDPARLGAQVVSGIGFLGAGTIIQNGTDIKGLTTAATIWLCGGIGLACGSAYFSGAIIATIVSLITLVLLVNLEIRLNRKSPRIMMIVGSDSTVLKEIMELSNTFDVEIRDIRSHLVKDKNGVTTCHLTIQLSKKSYLNIQAFSEELKLRLSPIDFKLYNR